MSLLCLPPLEGPTQSSPGVLGRCCVPSGAGWAFPWSLSPPGFLLGGALLRPPSSPHCCWSPLMGASDALFSFKNLVHTSSYCSGTEIPPNHHRSRKVLTSATGIGVF